MKKKLSLILSLCMAFTTLPAQIFGTLTASAETFQSAIEKNSTLVKSQNFDGGAFTAGGKVVDSYVDNIQGLPTKDGFYTSTEKVSDGNLALYLERDMSKNSTDRVYTTWRTDCAVDSPYMIVSYKSKSNSENDGVQFRLYYDNLTNGVLVPDGDVGTYIDTWGNGGLPLYIKNDRIVRDSPHGEAAFGCDNIRYFTSGQYSNEWHTYTYLIDAVARKAYLYIDGSYFMSLVIVNNRNSSGYNGDNGKFVEGLQYLQFVQEKYNNAVDGRIKRTYYDDLQLRKMSDEQMGELLKSDIDFNFETIANGDKLPVRTKSYYLPVVWTTDNGAVNVGADGVVVAKASASGKNVIFTAKVGSAVIGTYSAEIYVEGASEEGAEVLFHEPFNYVTGQSISQTAAAAKGWSVQNESTIPSGKGSTSLVMADPSNSENSVLDIETLTTAYTSANRYVQITGPFKANDKKYIMINKKVNITTDGNNCIFYINGSFADAETGVNAYSNSILIQFTYDMQNNKFGHDFSSGYEGIASPGITVGKWSDAKFIIDCEAQTYNFYMDNVKINSEPLDLFTKAEGMVVSGIHSIAMGTNRWHKTSGHYYIDDLTISALDEKGIVMLDADNLKVPGVTATDFEIPSVGAFGSEISWSSNNAAIVVSGDRACVEAVDNDTDVELTAEIKCGDIVETRVFTVTLAGDKDRIDGMGKALTAYIFSGQKYVMESFTPNIPGLSASDAVEITADDSAVAYDKASNKVIITPGEEDKMVNVTVKVTSSAGNSFTKAMKFYVPFVSIVGFYEGFDYPELKGSSISGAEKWKHSNENADLSKTGSTAYVEASPDDETDLVLDNHVLRTYSANQYMTLSQGSSIAGNAVLQANIKFGDNAANQYIWYVYGNVKTSSSTKSVSLLELYIKRDNGTLTCKSAGGTATVTTTPLPTKEWFNLKLVIHSTENTFDVYKDNVKLNANPLPLAEIVEGGTVTEIGSMQFGGSRWNSKNGHMYIDDIMVRSVASDIFETEAKMISIPDTYIYDYKMPTEGIYEGTTISWKSSNESLLSSDGKVNRNIGLGHTDVTLTAQLKSGSATFEKDFDVKVINTPNYMIDSIQFETVEGDLSYSAAAGGKIKNLYVTKNTTDTNDNATAYVAVFDASGKIVAVASPEKITETGKLKIDMQLPDREDMYAKAFVLNSQTLEPLAYSYSTKVAEGATVFTIGDSTMQSYGTIEARQNDNGMTGWAQVLPLGIKNNSLTIENKAVAGTSTLSFTNDGYIYPVYENIKQGDYLVIQFGHNDEKPWMDQDAGKNFSPLEENHQSHPNANPVPDWAKNRKTYEQWLRDYAAAARMKGAQVIFATSIYRHAFNNGQPAYSHYGYPEAMVDTADETGIPVLDLCTRSGEWLGKYGEAGSLKYYLAFHGGTDHTHLTYDGAVEIANMAIDEMNRIGHPIAEYFGNVPARN